MLCSIHRYINKLMNKESNPFLPILQHKYVNMQNLANLYCNKTEMVYDQIYGLRIE